MASDSRSIVFELASASGIYRSFTNGFRAVSSVASGNDNAAGPLRKSQRVVNQRVSDRRRERTFCTDASVEVGRRP